MPASSAPTRTAGSHHAVTSTCATGCCGSSDGQCHTQDSFDAALEADLQHVTAAQSCTGGVCANKCTAATCPNGCCDSSGNCVTTLTDGQCGTNGAACGACTGSNHCTQGQCGCSTSADCPMYQACQPDHVCSNSCGATATCNGGCCNQATSQCAQGTASAACGTNSGMCAVCAGSTQGSVCESNGSCGCSVAGNCRAGSACNTTTHLAHRLAAAACPARALAATGQPVSFRVPPGAAARFHRLATTLGSGRMVPSRRVNAVRLAHQE